MSRTTKRLVEVLALAMIGEGVMVLLEPRRYVRFWRIGPAPMRQAMDSLAGNPDAARLLATAEIITGVRIARAQLEP